MQDLKPFQEDTQPFSLDSIPNLETLNDYHLNQLNRQLRLELRHLNNEVGLNVNLSDDDDDEEEGNKDEYVVRRHHNSNHNNDDSEERSLTYSHDDPEHCLESRSSNTSVDLDLDVDIDVATRIHIHEHRHEHATEHINVDGSVDEDGDVDLNEYTSALEKKIDQLEQLDHTSIENAFSQAFNESGNEPFRNYIKSIVDRGQSTLGHRIPHLQLNNNSVINQSGINIDGVDVNVDVDVDVDVDEMGVVDMSGIGDALNDDTAAADKFLLESALRGMEEEQAKAKASIRASDAAQDAALTTKTHKQSSKKNTRINGLRSMHHTFIINGTAQEDDGISFDFESGLEGRKKAKKMKFDKLNLNFANLPIRINHSGLDTFKMKNNLGVIESNVSHKVPKSDDPNVKKCSRCRMKRLSETELELQKYQTCMQCRERRKVKKKRPRVMVKLPNLQDDWQRFVEKVRMNTVIDLHQHNYRAHTNQEEFPRYSAEEITPAIARALGEKIVIKYIHPLQDVTGYKFSVRDHHKPHLMDVNRAKKITWMFICSQDKTTRRKSRGENKRQILNRVKTEECCSRIAVSYDIVYGIVQVSYNHNHHKPLDERARMLNGCGHYTDQEYSSNDAEKDFNSNSGEGDSCSDQEAGNVISRSVIEAAAAAVAAATVQDDDEEVVETTTNQENRITDLSQRLAHSNAQEVRTDTTSSIDSIIRCTTPNDGKITHPSHDEVTRSINAIAREYEQSSLHNVNTHYGDVGDIGMMGDVDVGVDMNVDVDVDVDVAEIAKLLKQVQQEQNRRVDDTGEQILP